MENGDAVNVSGIVRAPIQFLLFFCLLTKTISEKIIFRLATENSGKQK